MNQAPDAPPPGALLAGKYRVDRVLGRGGMGVVVAATQLPIDEPVAVKLLHASVVSDPELVLRFEREAKAARKIKSEHVVRILDVGTLETGAPYLVMEHLEGADLDAIVRRMGPQPIAVAIDYLLQAMEALAEAHVQGMVHRDLKPANLFVSRRADGSPLVKVLDFGISKVTGQGGAELHLTKTGAKVLGSPLYMAPEQMRSLRTVDARADIWALGVILYELLAGVPPFNGATMTELCAVILQDPPPPLRGYRPDVPPAIEAAILRCLQKDPAARYPNVAALAYDLAPFASPAGRFSAERVGGVLRAMSPPMTSAPVVVSAPPPRPNVTTAPKSWGDTVPAPAAASSNRRLIVGLGAGAIAMATLAVVMGIVAWKSKGPVTEIHYLSDSKEKSSDEEAETPKTKATEKEDKPPADVVRILPKGGNYGKAFDVTLSTRTPNATIHYTTDHSEPTPASPVYTKPIHVAATTLVKAIAVSPAHAPSPDRFESYLIFPNSIETPSVVDLGQLPCGMAAKSQTFTVKNPGAATTIHVEMRDGSASPFLVSGDGELPARGEAKIRVEARPLLGVSSLDGLTDVVEIHAGNGLLRHVTVTEIATGPAFEVLDDGDLDFGGVAVGKKSPPSAVRIRSRGTVDAILHLTVTGPGGFEVKPATLVVPAGETRAAHVTFAPAGTAGYAGGLHVAHEGAHPGCSEAVTVKLHGLGAAR